MADPSKAPFTAAFVTAIFGIILTVVALATPEWTNSNEVTIGLWTITDESGTMYYWTDTGIYEDFFYSTWLMSVRAMMMAGIILGGLGILFNAYVIKKRQSSSSVGSVLLCYYILAFALVIISVLLYSCLIPQGVTLTGSITTNSEDIKDYIYTSGYGYSIWIGWVASGFFLLASGMAYEGSHQRLLANKMIDYINA